LGIGPAQVFSKREECEGIDHSRLVNCNYVDWFAPYERDSGRSVNVEYADTDHGSAATPRPRPIVRARLFF